MQEEYYDDHSYYEQEQQEIGHVVEEMTRAVPRVESVYKNILLSVNGRYVYSTLGEDVPILSESDLARLEQEVGFSFPSDYREFITDCGGYSFLPSLKAGDIYRPSLTFPIRGFYIGFYGEISYFHGNIPNDYHDLLGHYQRLKDFLPVGVLPIADAGRICLILSDECRGYIYKMPPEVIEFMPYVSDGPTTRLDPYSFEFLAYSFDEFIQSLRNKKPEG